MADAGGERRLRGWRLRRAAWLVPALCALSLVAPVHAAEPEELLLEIRYRGSPQGEWLPAFFPQDEPALFLAEALMDALAIQFESDRDGALAGIRQPGNVPFRVAPDGRWESGADSGQWPAGHLAVIHGGLYLSAQAIAMLLPVKLELEQDRQRLTVQATGPLPLDLHAQRERARDRLASAGALEPPAPAPFPYRATGRLSGDLQVNAQHRSQAERASLRHHASLVSELAWMTTHLFVRGDDREGVRDARIQLGRASPEGGAFGVPGLTSAFVGDVSTSGIPLAGSEHGRGLRISNMPLERPDSFDATTLEGEAPPGWEVELYRGSELLAFGRTTPDGRYSFPDVPLEFGDNAFRVVLYGPDGQTREITERARIGAGMVPPGRVDYRLFGVERRRRVFEDFLPQERREASDVYSLEADLGVTRHLTARAFTAKVAETIRPDSPTREVHGAGARIAAGRLFLEGDVVRQEGGGKAWELNALGGLGRMTLALRHAEFDGFHSIRASRGLDRLRRDSRVRVSTSVPSPVGSLGVSLFGEQRTFVSGREEDSVRLQLRHGLRGAAISHELDRRRQRFAQGRAVDRLYWQPTVSVSRGTARITGTGRYDLEGSRLQFARFGSQWRIGERTSLSASLSHYRNWNRSSLNYVSAGVSRDFMGMYASLTGSYDSDGRYTLMFGLSTSFVMANGGTAFASHPQTGRGAADVFVFHDRNADGRFDPEYDEPLPDVTIVTDRGRRHGRGTGPDGRVTITDLLTTRAVELDIDQSSLPDPFLAPASGGVRFYPRPGQPFQAEIAVVDTAEASGQVMVENGGDVANGLSGAFLDLSRREAPGEERVIASGRSQEAGFFLFDRLPPGGYRLRIREGQQLNGTTLAPAELDFVVRPDEPMVEGLELRVPATTGKDR